MITVWSLVVDSLPRGIGCARKFSSLPVLALSAAACGPSNNSEVRASHGDVLAEQYQIVVSHEGSDADRCAKAEEVAQGYLADGNSAKYGRWKQTQTDDCRAAESVQRLNESMKGANDAIGKFTRGY